MKSTKWFFSYLFVATIGLWFALVTSMKFMAPAMSQEAPSDGTLPAEVLKDIEATQVPVPPPPADGIKATQDVPVPVPAATPLQDQIQSQGQDATSELAQPEPAEPPSLDIDREYFYDPAGKRDPFKVFRTVRPLSDKTSSVPLEPLQKFEIDKLQVVGILWDVRSPRAMVLDPDGVVHTIVKNSKLGRSEGFVAVIREGEVVVMETHYEDGKSFKAPRVLELMK